MKFTIPVLTLCHGGAQRMLVELANGLTRRGHQVCLLMPSGSIVEYKIEAQILQTNQTVLRESDYPYSDVIVSNYYLTVPSAQAASKLGKGKHIRLSLCYEPAFLPNNHISFPTYHLTDCLIVLSSWQHRLIQLLHGIQSTIVPVGVDPLFTNLHIRENNHKLRIAAILREPEGFAFHRNQEHLISQLLEITKRYPNVEVSLISPPGEMARSPELNRLRAMLGFLFYTPANDYELRYHFNQADIFVTSSLYEAANLPGLEAMNCGAALVAVNSGGNEDYCNHLQNCLISYQYQGLMGEHISQLIENPELRHRLAKEGELEAAKWTWTRSLNLFEQAVYNFIKKD